MIAENKYGKYYIDNSFKHRPACKVVISNGVHEEETIEFIIANSKGKSIVSAGTFFGDFLPAFKDLKKVYTFEPVKLNYDCALKTIELNGLKNVEIYNLGLSNNNCSLKMRTESNGRHFGGYSRIREDGNEEIKCVTLDSILKEEISILQLDIEEHEEYALIGAKEIINKWKPIIIVEINYESDIIKFVDLIKDICPNHYNECFVIYDEYGNNLVIFNNEFNHVI